MISDTAVMSSNTPTIFAFCLISDRSLNVQLFKNSLKNASNFRKKTTSINSWRTRKKAGLLQTVELLGH